MAPLQLHTLAFRRLCAAACNVQIAQPKAQPACIAIRPAASASPAAQLEQACRRPPSILACNRLLLGVPGRSPCGWVCAWRRHCWVPSCRGWRHVTSWHLLGLHGRVHDNLLWGRLDHLHRLHRLGVVRGTHQEQGVDHACGRYGLSAGAGVRAHAAGGWLTREEAAQGQDDVEEQLAAAARNNKYCHGWNEDRPESGAAVASTHRGRLTENTVCTRRCSDRSEPISMHELSDLYVSVGCSARCS